MAVRLGIGTLALALSAAGCASQALLTGATGPCGWAGPPPVLRGVLLADPEFGTVLRVEGFDMEYPTGFPDVGDTVPVMWPSGYTGRWVAGEVAVRTGEGTLVATTGGSITLAAPGPLNVFDGLSYPADHGAYPTCGAMVPA